MKQQTNGRKTARKTGGYPNQWGLRLFAFIYFSPASSSRGMLVNSSLLLIAIGKRLVDWSRRVFYEWATKEQCCHREGAEIKMPIFTNFIKVL
ncbi:hypothetical protein BBD42_10500 [Paenibacillus sp. BIHB 4019]|uniref:Uncharacterized protein n=1 Tax=Paenibacillus sp. BIHB 4019 TaxID=1870819 RepID=A0A1B2DGI8_9BACL|nr:hypothetical protein BBD42_10500 [Paenibacillus sp. BIHB 4019]